MDKFKNWLRWFFGFETKTNREAILDELAAMGGWDFFVRTGLVFNDAVADEAKGDYEAWLDQPATMKNYFGGGDNGTEVRCDRSSGRAEAVL
ncbi:MAG: hypothetical protein E7317_05300 [Clostridiales bacterium]|nr:hypothetical protein [Clostridiales bacterium]